MALRAEGIWFGYGETAVLADVSLAVEPGERVALLAPSGRGKTTLCQILVGYLRPWEGRVLVDGVPLVEGRRGGALAHRRAGALPVQLLWQHPEQAFDPRVRMGRSLAEAAPADDPRFLALCERFGVSAAWFSRLPHELSGGELMRCAMVRALAVHPRYLIADEATAMLDAVTQADLWRALIKVADAEEMGMLLVSHSEALVRRVATRTVRLD